MTLAEAARLVKLFASYWPSAPMPKETAALWAREVQQHDPQDVAEAAALLGESRQWMPSLAEFLMGIKECHRDRVAQQTRMLAPVGDSITFTRWLSENPEWRERVSVLTNDQREKDRLGKSSIIDALALILRHGL